MASATSNQPILPLIVAQDIEPERSWENIKTPQDMVNYAAQRLGVDAGQFNAFEDIILSSVEPTGEDRSKLWGKTEGVPAIGIPVGGIYRMIWQYPPNIPLLWINQKQLPNGMRRLTEAELTLYGLTNPADVNYYYVINEVPE